MMTIEKCKLGGVYLNDHNNNKITVLKKPEIKYRNINNKAMRTSIQANFITKKQGSIIYCEGSGVSSYFRIGGELKVFKLDESKILHGIRKLISKGLLASNISPIQYDVVCNQINNS
jgi:hypothetical protein